MQAAGPAVSEGRVSRDWVDYNGHMNYAYYVVAFDQGTDVLFEALDLGTSYRERAGRTLYVVETHIAYHRELKCDDRFIVETILADADQKRLHLYQSLCNALGEVCATSEVLCLHVNNAGNEPRAEAFGDIHLARVQELARAHQDYPRQLSRAIAIRKPRPAANSS
jgi:acyl-CoA thioester hydrolase